MAYAALASLAQLLEHIQDQDPFVFPFHDKHQIESLYDNTISLLAFLDEFPDDASILEEHITTAANHTEDIIEYQISDAIRSKYACCGVIHCVQKAFPCFFTACRIEFHKDLQNAVKEISSIEEEANQAMQLKDSTRSSASMTNLDGSALSPGGEGVVTTTLDGSTLSPRGEGVVVGFKQDSDEIKARLCGESSELQTIPIIGMGGIGKTTLAQLVYNDPLVLERFDFRGWATVSQQFDKEKVLHDIYSSTKEPCDAGNKDIGQCVYQYLMGRRYLLVIDDIWDTNVWDSLRQLFPNDSNGSRIIVTSRQADVASYIDKSSPVHQMDLMSDDQSWNLLRMTVFGQENECCPEIEKIGKFIAQKCGGLPLAIVVIAGILSKTSNGTEATWQSFARNVTEAANSSNEPLTEILSLSYRHLPHHLRPCFLYMGAFPEDYEIDVSKIVKLWAAEGFLKPNRSKHPEDVAEEYIEDLTKRSLLMITKKKYNNKIKSFKIHDLLRNLCLRNSHNEKFMQVIKNYFLGFPDDMRKWRRVSTFPYVLRRFEDCDNSSIRTILLPFPGRELHSWKGFELLRILDATGVELHSFPIEIGDLLHLRLLAFTLTRYGKFMVPRTLSKLRNLLTLIVKSYRVPKALCLSLPYEIWGMPQLRHLILYNALLPNPSVGATLLNLSTLSCIAQFTCSRRIVELLPNVKKLGIVYSMKDIVKGWSSYHLNNLVHFQMLEKLDLNVVNSLYQPVLSKSHIVFPITLKKLSLSGCGIPWEDMTIIGSLPNLEVLKMKNDACYGGDEWATSEGEFCRLRVLEIENSDPRRLDTESSHFPRLQLLLLRQCTMLTEIPKCIGDVATLELIEVDSCFSRIEESAKRIKEEQVGLGNELEVRILHSGAAERVFANTGIGGRGGALNSYRIRTIFL